MKAAPRVADAPMPVPDQGPARRRLVSTNVLVWSLWVALLGWAFVITQRAYVFGDAAALRVVRDDFSWFDKVLTQIPKTFGLALLTVWFVLSTLGAGCFALRALKLSWHDQAERLLFGVAVGLMLATYGLMAVGAVGLLRPKLIIIAMIAGTALGVWEADRSVRAWLVARRARPARSRTPRSTAWTVLLVGCVVGGCYIALLGALGPEVQFDARVYHLGPALHYADAHRFYNMLTATSYGLFAITHYQQVLYTGLVSISGLVAAKLLEWVDVVLTVGAIIVLCRVHFRSVRLGLVAALIYVTIPVVAWSASTGGNDVPTSLATVLAVHAYFSWRRDRTWGWLVLIGACLGYGFGVKSFTAFAVPAFAIAIVGSTLDGRFRGRKVADLMVAVKNLCITGIAAVVAVTPYFIREAAMTGNPMFPVLNSVFHDSNNFYSMPLQRKLWELPGARRTVWGFLSLPWDSVAHGNYYRSVVGPLFVLVIPVFVLGIAMLVRRVHFELKFMAIMSVGWTVLWFWSGAFEFRYMQTIFPLLAIAVAYPLVIAQWPGIAGKVLKATLVVLVALGVLLNTQFLVPFQRHASVATFGRATIPWSFLYGSTTERQMTYVYMPVQDWMNKNVPAHIKVFDDAQLFLLDAYTRPDIYVKAGDSEWNPQDFYGERSSGSSIFGSRAPKLLERQHAGFVAVHVADADRFAASPAGRGAKEVFRSTGDIAVFRMPWEPAVAKQLNAR